MSAYRWSILFLMLAGACVTVDCPAQAEAAAPAVSRQGGEGEAFRSIDRRTRGAVSLRIAPDSANLRHRPAASPLAGLP
ncbi:MAG TPA: hypothetical protein VH394_01625 [Thermoanaerobaculia bacterium]|jgi:hypothetical protein|nr:hypothetical protein [Thermoanaerobaculia bacterium]